MKNSYFARLCAFSVILLSALMFSVQSCDKKEKPVDTEEVADEANDAKLDNDTVAESDDKEDDAKFLVDAAATDLEEIQLGKLAQLKGINADVKAHGKMMETEHTKASDKIKPLATAKNITLPTSLTEDGQDAYNKLNEKKGADFDKAYVDMMIDGHKKAIKLFEDNAQRTKDVQIKDWATATLPILNTHLQHFETLKAQLK
jgi:putative membrane protein